MQTGVSDREAITGINVTPLVDVCLVLVIIFMVTAPLFMQPVLKVALPKATTKEGEEKENITLTLTADGHWAINEKEFKLEDVARELPFRVADSRDQYVIIRADQEVEHRWMLEAMKMAKEAGAKQIHIATEQKKR